MAECLPYPAREIDLLYEQCARNLAFGIFASAGDSHAVKLDEKAKQLLDELRQNGSEMFGYTNEIFSKGGLKSESYFEHELYSRLKRSEANIIVLMLGGNDLDSDRISHVDVLKHHIRLFNELTDQFKIVYICELPARFSVRTTGLTVDQYKKQRKTLFNQQFKRFENRLIPLPSQCFNEENFQKQYNHNRGMWEIVHLKDEFYRYMAIAVLEHIKQDLANRSSLPLKEKISVV